MKRICTILALSLLLSGCFHFRRGKVDPAPQADTVMLSPDTVLIIEEAPSDEVLDGEGNISADPVVAEKPVAAVSAAGAEVFQAEGLVEFDKIVHDFGDFTVKDGPQTCTFTVKNIGPDPMAIYEVITSCGCTDATWTREPVLSGRSGKITVTYQNEDGPYPFDKTLTVYLSSLKKPFILRIRGSVHEKKQSLEESFGAVRAGALGFKERSLNAGNLEQGERRSDQATLANLGRTPAQVSFTQVSEGLTLSLSPNPVPARSTAVLTYTVEASREKWGRNIYSAVPVVGGKSYPGATLLIRAVTKENFSDWTEEEKANGSLPLFDESTVSFGTVTAGTPVTAAFTLTNKGKSPFVCYKADSENPHVTFAPMAAVPPGGKGTLTVTLDTTSLPAGDNDVYINLVTNSPSRPLISLFLIGSVEAISSVK